MKPVNPAESGFFALARFSEVSGEVAPDSYWSKDDD
jgi:hypothetical protein